MKNDPKNGQYIVLFVLHFSTKRPMASYFNGLNTNTTKRHIEAEEAFEATSRILYKDVVRKNQEIIKQILSNINDLYSKQEELDYNMRTINEKITRLNEATQELHHQFRDNHIQIERKHQTLTNELNGFKGALKVPQQNRNHEEYLQSSYFKVKSAMVSVRTRSKGKIGYKTNSKLLQEAQKQMNAENLYYYQLNGKARPYSELKIVQKSQKQKVDFLQYPIRNELSNSVAAVQPFRASDNTQLLINEKINQLQHKFQFSLSKTKDQIKIRQMQLSQAVNNLQSQIQLKLQKISKSLQRENNWGQINFQESQNYLQIKIKEQLHQKISKRYFQQSLINLKESWQEQLNSLYETINTKLDQQSFQLINERISQICSKQHFFNNINSIKPQNQSYNSTCKSTPQKCAGQRKSYGDSTDSVRNSRETEEPRLFKKELPYSSSCSSLTRSKEYKKTGLEEKYCIPKSYEEKVGKWKNRVTETLRLKNTKVRRIKRSDQFNK